MNVLADFSREQGGSIMSILSVEYDTEIAMRYCAEERVEEIVKKMIAKGYSASAISEITGLNETAVLQIKKEHDNE